jgi:hypothetical protein
MSTGILDKELLTFEQAAALFPRPPHVNTVHRWAADGSRGVRLKSWLVAGLRYTSREAVDEFILATTAAAEATSA